jgi:hypothetical protein
VDEAQPSDGLDGLTHAHLICQNATSNRANLLCVGLGVGGSDGGWRVKGIVFLRRGLNL